MKKNFALVILMLLCLSLSAQETGNFTDERDGKTYDLISLGDQVWMSQNMNFEIADQSWCFQDSSHNCDELGRLYAHEAAMEACPAGWHLPAMKEWEILLKHLGGADAFGQLSFSGLSKIAPNLLEGGSSGLNVVLAGWRIRNGYDAKGSGTIFHTSTLFNDDEFHKVGVYKRNGVDLKVRQAISENHGYYIRCVKD